MKKEGKSNRKIAKVFPAKKKENSLRKKGINKKLLDNPGSTIETVKNKDWFGGNSRKGVNLRNGKNRFSTPSSDEI